MANKLIQILAALQFIFFSCTAKENKDEFLLNILYGDTLRVMTYNIHHANPPSREQDGAIDIGAIANVIIKSNPDLVALQEIDNQTTRSGISLNEAKELGRLTGMNYYFSCSMEYRGGWYGNAILSKFPIADTFHYHLPPMPGQPGEVRSVGIIKVVLPNNKQLYFASTHLDAGRNEVSRLVQAQKIIDSTALLTLPFIIGGDFNARPESKTIVKLDSFFVRTCINNCPLTIPTINPQATIDYIMYKPKNSFEVISVKAINETYASDHLPVVAELIMK